MAIYHANPGLNRPLGSVLIQGKRGELIVATGPSFDMSDLDDEAVALLEVDGLRALLPGAPAGVTGTYPSATTYPSDTTYPGA